MSRTLLLFCVLAVAGILPSAAGVLGQQDGGQSQPLLNGTAFFVPHWYVRAQGGVGCDVGESGCFFCVRTGTGNDEYKQYLEKNRKE